MLQALLSDEVPNVRAAAAAAVAQALGSFWEAIPSSTSKVLLTTLATNLASDKSSVIVRVAAVDALAALLENPLAHPVLKILLPSVRNLVHDTSEK